MSESDVAAILKEAKFTGYRLDGSLAWIMKSLSSLTKIDEETTHFNN